MSLLDAFAGLQSEAAKPLQLPSNAIAWRNGVHSVDISYGAIGLAQDDRAKQQFVASRNVLLRTAENRQSPVSVWIPAGDGFDVVQTKGSEVCVLYKGHVGWVSLTTDVGLSAAKPQDHETEGVLEYHGKIQESLAPRTFADRKSDAATLDHNAVLKPPAERNDNLRAFEAFRQTDPQRRLMHVSGLPPGGACPVSGAYLRTVSPGGPPEVPSTRRVDIQNRKRELVEMPRPVEGEMECGRDLTLKSLDATLRKGMACGLLRVPLGRIALAASFHRLKVAALSSRGLDQRRRRHSGETGDSGRVLKHTRATEFAREESTYKNHLAREASVRRAYLNALLSGTIALEPRSCR